MPWLILANIFSVDDLALAMPALPPGDALSRGCGGCATAAAPRIALTAAKPAARMLAYAAILPNQPGGGPARTRACARLVLRNASTAPQTQCHLQHLRSILTGPSAQSGGLAGDRGSGIGSPDQRETP